MKAAFSPLHYGGKGPNPDPKVHTTVKYYLSIKDAKGSTRTDTYATHVDVVGIDVPALKPYTKAKIQQMEKAKEGKTPSASASGSASASASGSKGSPKASPKGSPKHK